ncbi:MAG TPA: spore maturation protein [Elusimicrobia bacterium]|nr:MAG: spore maturation protein [Elusimicrobia bacterium RIFOXYA12_FULL_49_49]OGS06198.1 MAG: spore maturation protein [Elusimicrobia bacterium RIFOXYA1_FULL_47_7]OGS15324.1 MAG: spore maturation protein [Elusimicrobia bacterium RIFOXYA2_FULL_47_53]OGS26454.1 MAG: spore maturation protein [Elusimicrobia bacterium RIFOXYB12_FULL_50_12]OGS30579.1 MAG: spore maturation protein [Elusimicrobia bacterium RIFOXYB2_FULL_46_23]HBU69813.1 spore maturation protein [Elusimicrobiota bacterium]
MDLLNYFSQALIPVFILFTVAYGLFKKVRLYDSFVSGAKDGIDVIIKIFPYILAIFLAIKTFQASGAYDSMKAMLAWLSPIFNIPVDVFSIAIIKPLSGSAALGIFTDIVKTTGPDSMASRISAVIIGSAETTFYVLAVYLGAVGIKKTKYLVPVCLIADIFGIITAIAVVKLIF